MSRFRQAGGPPSRRRARLKILACYGSGQSTLQRRPEPQHDHVANQAAAYISSLRREYVAPLCLGICFLATSPILLARRLLQISIKIGQFSPTEVRQASEANQILTAMSNHDLRLDQVVVASEPLPNQLQKAELIDFRVEPDAFIIRARSEGHSVLLLPWEFSCSPDLARVR